MANSGYIIVKGKEGTEKRVTYRNFYGPLDKGSAKPAFCYPRLKDSLKEEISTMEKSLEHGYIDKTKELQVRDDLSKKRDRLGKIEASESDAKKLFQENKDQWMKRRRELGDLISEALPTEKDLSKRRVNPHRIMEMEKKKGLGDAKLEYAVLSKLADEESNTSFLRKES